MGDGREGRRSMQKRRSEAEGGKSEVERVERKSEVEEARDGKGRIDRRWMGD